MEIDPAVLAWASRKTTSPPRPSHHATESSTPTGGALGALEAQHAFRTHISLPTTTIPGSPQLPEYSTSSAHTAEETLAMLNSFDDAARLLPAGA